MKKALYVFLAGTLPLLVSCYNSRYAYSPSAHNVPVLKKAGDSKIAGYYSMNNPATTGYSNGVTTYSRGFDGQAAVAITNHFAIMANYYRRWEKNGGDEDYYNVDISQVYYSRELVEGALGYYTALGDGEKVYLQIFTGGAIGKFKIDDYSINHVLKNYHYSDVSKMFMQPAIQFAISKSFAASASTKFTYVYYSDIKTSYTEEELEYYRLKNLNVGNRIFFEPAFTCNFGPSKLPGLRFEGQFGFSFLWGQQFLDYRFPNFSMGVVADIGKLLHGAPAE